MRSHHKLFIISALVVSATQLAHAAPGDVIISEIAWAGSQASTNDEWLELHNTTSAAVDVGGWTIAESNGTSGATLAFTTSVNFAAGTSIPAGGFLLVRARSGAALQ